jgi:hypothetical protein
MAAPTFLEVLRSEVARMQALHPEREGELARAHALILHGQVLPSAEDPQTGQVLSSDGQKTYSVNGACNCSAGQHGKGCKHLQAWKLYQYITRKVEARPTLPALPEAPASVNCHITIAGRQVQLTLRDVDEGRLLERLAVVLDQYPVPEPAKASSQSQGQGRAWCAKHGVALQVNHGKDGRTWLSHRTPEGQWCKGR